MFDALSATLVSLGLRIINFFPASPIQPLLATMSDPDIAAILGYVNWFVPIGRMLGVLSVWLTCIAAYYVYQIILRWIKVIE